MLSWKLNRTQQFFQHWFRVQAEWSVWVEELTAKVFIFTWKRQRHRVSSFHGADGWLIINLIDSPSNHIPCPRPLVFLLNQQVRSERSHSPWFLLDKHTPHRVTWASPQPLSSSCSLYLSNRAVVGSCPLREHRVPLRTAQNRQSEPETLLIPEEKSLFFFTTASVSSAHDESVKRMHTKKYKSK